MLCMLDTSKQPSLNTQVIQSPLFSSIGTPTTCSPMLLSAQMPKHQPVIFNYYKQWTEDENIKLQMLREKGQDWDQISKQFHRTRTACRVQYYRATKNQHSFSQQFSRSKQWWTPEEENIIKGAYYNRVPWEIVGDILHRSPKSCSTHFSVLKKKENPQQTTRQSSGVNTA